MLKTKLLLCLEDNKATVGVIGLGKTGWPLACRMAMHNIPALGFSMCPEIAETTNNGVNYLHDKTVPDDPGTVRQKYVYKDLLHGTTDLFSAIHRDFVFICVDDLADELKQDVHTTLSDYTDGIACALRDGSVLILVSYNADFIADKIKAVEIRLHQRTGLEATKEFSVMTLNTEFILNTSPDEILRYIQKTL